MFKKEGLKMREFNVEKQTKQLIEYTREWFNKFGTDSRAIIGISGGKDSSVTAAVLKEAIGTERIRAIDSLAVPSSLFLYTPLLLKMA